MNIDINQSRVIETDTKPIKNVTNNLSKFIEQFQNEIDQIKDEYIMKFTKDRASIEHEINRLMNDERVTLDKLQRYLSQHRKRSSIKSSDNKRKHS
jgi:Mg2+ and Co2+ transporter CorA